jgi:hypothetical protein
VLSKQPGWTLFADQTGNRDAATAQTVFTTMLGQHPDINAVMVANDTMAQSVINVLRSQSLAGKDRGVRAGRHRREFVICSGMAVVSAARRRVRRGRPPGAGRLSGRAADDVALPISTRAEQGSELGAGEEAPHQCPAGRLGRDQAGARPAVGEPVPADQRHPAVAPAGRPLPDGRWSHRGG